MTKKTNKTITCISDFHGLLTFKIEPCDLLLIAGDLLPAYHDKFLSANLQINWLQNEFKPWLKKQPVKETCLICGNHCWLGEIDNSYFRKIGKKVHYLQDEEITIQGIRIYGTPHSPEFNNWAFGKTEKSLEKYWSNIPENIDILLCHCPPFNIFDKTYNSNGIYRNIGSPSLNKRIDIIRPKYVVFGHAHGEYGRIKIDNIEYINCSLMNELYDLCKKPITIQ